MLPRSPHLTTISIGLMYNKEIIAKRTGCLFKMLLGKPRGNKGEETRRILKEITASATTIIASSKHSLTPRQINLKLSLSQFLLPGISCLAFNKKSVRHTKRQEAQSEWAK